jgi:ABC-type nickel/cobalt efflux system permease component RcnA
LTDTFRRGIAITFGAALLQLVLAAVCVALTLTVFTNGMIPLVLIVLAMALFMMGIFTALTAWMTWDVRQDAIASLDAAHAAAR